ncbi:hypothetical protein CH333_09900 [candidate division WOR-3 bacterium JGI_Cruoil_03_44_89]|uniref:DUF3857 domain-containing protein n=1 Tax=candidate division WOR-3 bacterium JGI_Cruoil_03_44_89 TaxID=1973748 RepID=A0A235BQC7_UNCW3|nr:MAG: hypothetical protein CH333_09900 [candidate division WOR-3 bacterium JGI_Cruoil_03_44_89]
MLWLFVIFSLVLPRPDARDYPGASAIYVLDSTSVLVKVDLSGQTYRHVVMRVFDKRGRDKHSNFMQRYDADNEKVELLLDKTHTIKQDGDTVEISREEGIGDLSTVSAAMAPAYSNARIKLCAFGGVEPGDFLEYTSEKSRKKPKDKTKALFGTIKFASDEPIMHKVFVLELPGDLRIKYKIVGDVKVDSVLGEGKTIYTFSSDSIVRISHEEWMLPIEAVGQRVVYTTFTSWDDVGSWLRDDFEKSIEHKGELAKKAKELGNIKSICESVALDWRDIPLGFDDIGFRPKNTKNIYKNRYGSPLDKVALLVAMLRSIGKKAYPAYIASSGIDEDIPTPIYFDGIVAAVDTNGEYIFLDPVFPSGRLSVSGVSGILDGDKKIYPLPFNRGCGTCFIVKEDTAVFYQMDKAPSKSEIKAELTLSEDGNLRGKIVGTLRGVDAACARKYWRGKNPKELKQVFEEFAARIKPGTKALSWKVSDLDSVLSPVGVEFEFTSPEYLVKLPDEYRFSLIMNIFGFVPLSSYFGCESRKYPFTVLSPRISELSTKIELPAGLKLTYIPGSLHIDNNLLLSSCDFEYEGGALSYKVIWGFKKGIYEPGDYGRLEDAHTEFVSPERSFVILKE